MKKHNLSFLNSKNDLQSIINWIDHKCYCKKCKTYTKYKNLFDYELNDDIYNLHLEFSKINLTKTMKKKIISELHYVLLKKKLFKLLFHQHK